MAAGHSSFNKFDFEKDSFIDGDKKGIVVLVVTWKLLIITMMIDSGAGLFWAGQAPKFKNSGSGVP